MMVVTSASDWQSAVGREVTIQVRRITGRDAAGSDIENRHEAVARGTAGVADVRAYTKEESEQLVEPWLGSGLSLQRVANSAHDRRQARLEPGAGFCRLAWSACGAGAERQPRRSPRLDRSHA